jgi:hypothetical protein
MHSCIYWPIATKIKKLLSEIVEVMINFEQLYQLKMQFSSVDWIRTSDHPDRAAPPPEKKWIKSKSWGIFRLRVDFG